MKERLCALVRGYSNGFQHMCHTGKKLDKHRPGRNQNERKRTDEQKRTNFHPEGLKNGYCK